MGFELNGREGSPIYLSHIAGDVYQFVVDLARPDETYFFVCARRGRAVIAPMDGRLEEKTRSDRRRRDF